MRGGRGFEFDSYDAGRGAAMRGLEWLRGASSQALKPVYVIYGDDVYLRREAVRAVVRAALPEPDEVGASRFEGGTAKLADVIDELHTLPFFSKRRVVLIDEADPFVTAHRKGLETYVESPSASGHLVLVVKSWPSNTNLAKLVAKVGLAVDCSAPKPADLMPWLAARAAGLGSKLEADAATLLLELVGPELGVLAAEVDKLSIATADTAKIRRQDVARLVEAGRIEDVWKVLDAAAEGKGSLAVKLLDDLIASGEPVVRMLAGISVSLLKVHHAGRLRSARLSLAEACRAAGIAPFAIDRTAKQHAHLGPSRVGQLPAMLLKADLDVKGGSLLEPRVILEALLVQLSLPRRD
jgi:DNA polymerase-3 subunit delta